MNRHKRINFHKKFLALFLVLVIAFSTYGCSLPKVFDIFSSDNIKNTQPNDTSNEDDIAFSEFADELFRETVSSDTITLHSFLQNPSDFNINDYDITLGRYDLDSLDDSSSITDTLTNLKSFNRDTLSYSQQITYDQLCIYLENQLEYSDLYLLGSQLSTTVGIQIQLPLIFAEYSFIQKKDIDEYLGLLEDVDGYFTNLVDFEKLRAAKGYFMEDKLADEIIEQCETFIASASTGYLITTFNDKIDSFSGLTDTEKSAYKEKNATSVTSHVINGYSILKDGLTALKGTNKYNGGLCNYPDGSRYFEYLLKDELGCDKTVPELNSLLDTYLMSYMVKMQALMSKDSTLIDKYDSFTFSLTDPAGILEDLKKRIVSDYPEIPNVSYDIKYIEKALQDYASPAMYFLPQLDNLSSNSIYINPASTSGDGLYTTLAHEGYPGHLYQTQYFASTNPDLIRYLIEPGGYVEGWATYVEVSSYGYAQTGNAALNSLMMYNYATILCLYGKVDIGVNYSNWTVDDVYSFISGYGFNDKSIAEDMYYSMVSEPANYCQYVLGFLSFNELKIEAQESLGSSFNLKDFHQFLLDMGPVPFDMLEAALPAWAEKAQYK